MTVEDYLDTLEEIEDIYGAVGDVKLISVTPLADGYLLLDRFRFKKKLSPEKAEVFVKYLVREIGEHNLRVRKVKEYHRLIPHEFGNIDFEDFQKNGLDIQAYAKKLLKKF